LRLNFLTSSRMSEPRQKARLKQRLFDVCSSL
jgi:hypothetical protein